MTVKKNIIPIIPSKFIYEMDEGLPIYYKGTNAILRTTTQNKEPIPNSDFQSWLKGKLYLTLSMALMDNPMYDLTVGEHGLSLKKNLWRAADIAIFKIDNLALTNQYSKKPPEVVFEIDLKGEFESPVLVQKDHKRKIEQLFEFGVKKIIWVYTDARIAKVITPPMNIEFFEWDMDILVLENLNINIQSIMDKYYKK